MFLMQGVEKASVLPSFVLCLSVRRVNVSDAGGAYKGFHVATICSVMFVSLTG